VALESTKKQVWKRLGGLAKPLWLQLTGIIVLSLLATPLALLSPLPLQIAVDSVLSNLPLPSWLGSFLPTALCSTKSGELLIAAGLLLGTALVGSLQSLASWMLQTYTGEKLVHDFRSQLLWHVQRLSLAFHDCRGPNDTTYRIQYDAPAVQYILIQGLIPLITSAFGFVAMLWVTAVLNWQLAIVSLLLSPLLFLLARHSSKKVRAGYEEVKQLDSSAMLVMHEALSGVRSVKAFVQEGYEDELFRRKSRLRMLEQIRLASIQAGFHVLIGLTIAAGTAIALFIGVSQVMQGRISVGELLVIMAYMAQLYEPLRTMSTKIPELQASLASAERAFYLLEESPENADSGAPLSAQRIRGEVEFRHVSFQYTAGRKVLDNISFKTPPGSCVGIVGSSGSGKSTLVNLLTRFYEPMFGQVLLDGTDLRNWRLSDLRRQFAIVLQEPMLFSTTVAGNIAYARPNASRSEIREAGKLANADEFIMRLPKGYDTAIGEGGARLSGGECQRLAIARAFLSDAPLVILDEPTSAVDIKAESIIMDAVEKLMRGRTTFLIAHRLSTLEKCDIVLVLREGRLTMITRDLHEAKLQLLRSEPVADGIRPGLEPLGPMLVN
jgi:ATP-binding cassette subfamily B protein